MSVLDEFEKLRQAALVDEDGEAVHPEFLPPLDEARLRQIETQLGAQLPDDLRTLASRCGGINGLLDQIDFSGGLMFGQEEIFPRGVPFAADGFGNFWVVDVIATPEATAQVYYACHDAPVILFQCGSMAEFLAELARMHTPPHRSLIDDVHEDRLFEVWRKNPGTIAHAAALQSADAEVRAFAASLDERFLFVDLRHAAPGMGFSWGRFGPNTELRRHGEQRLFAYAKAPKKPGLLSRWFGHLPS